MSYIVRLVCKNRGCFLPWLILKCKQNWTIHDKFLKCLIIDCSWTEQSHLVVMLLFWLMLFFQFSFRLHTILSFFQTFFHKWCLCISPTHSFVLIIVFFICVMLIYLKQNEHDLKRRLKFDFGKDTFYFFGEDSEKILNVWFVCGSCYLMCFTFFCFLLCIVSIQWIVIYYFFCKAFLPFISLFHFLVLWFVSF